MRTSSGVGNSARKILSFYRINFAYVPPYRVLVDGLTIHDALTRDMYLKEALPRLLGAVSHVVVTACVVKWLREQGESHSGALLFAKRATRIACAHKGGDGSASVADCLSARLQAQDDDNKFMAGLTDPALLMKLLDIPGVPVVSIVNSVKLVLRPPTKATLDFLLHKASSRTPLLSEADKALVEKAKEAERIAREANRPTRQKRKRAKGPNPLSVKKPKIANKKNTQIAHPAVSCAEEGDLKKIGLDSSDKGDGTGDSLQKIKRRVRKRKRLSAIVTSGTEKCREAEVVQNTATDQNLEPKVNDNAESLENLEKEWSSCLTGSSGLSATGKIQLNAHPSVPDAVGANSELQEQSNHLKSSEVEKLENVSLNANESTKDTCKSEGPKVSLVEERGNYSTTKGEHNQNIDDGKDSAIEVKGPLTSNEAFSDKKNYGDEKEEEKVVGNSEDEKLANETMNAEASRKKKQRKNRRRPKNRKMNHQ